MNKHKRARVAFTPGVLAGLTYERVLRLQARAKGDRPDTVTVRDEGCPALSLRLARDSGGRTYVCMGMVKGTGRPCIVALRPVGGFDATSPDLDIAAARAAAAALKASLRAGVDPALTRARREATDDVAALTLEAVLLHFGEHGEGGRKFKANLLSRMRRYLAPWLPRVFLQISREDWQQVWGDKGAAMVERVQAAKADDRHGRRLSHTGLRTANTVRSEFSHLWRYFDRRWGDKVVVPKCPALMAVRKIKHRGKRVSTIDADNVGDLLAALRTYPHSRQHVFFYTVLLLTGMRSAEAKHLRWTRPDDERVAAGCCWIDRRRGRLVLPGEFTKTGVAGDFFYIPITAAVAKALDAIGEYNAREGYAGDPRCAPWVFPSWRAESGHLEENAPIYRSVGKHAGMRLDMHSTRHMFRDAMRAVRYRVDGDMVAFAETQIDAALNQATQGAGMGNTYGKRLSFEQHAMALDLIANWYNHQVPATASREKLARGEVQRHRLARAA